MALTIAEVEDRFVNDWGDLVTVWGLNKTMGQIHALLYITGEPLTADEIMERLNISRGNVSMNLRALMSWGVVHRQHRKGDRKQYFVAEEDPWRWFKNVVRERRKREVEPVIEAFSDTLALLPSPSSANGQHASGPGTPADTARLRARLEQMRDFVEVFNRGIDMFLRFNREDFNELMELLAATQDPGSDLARLALDRK
ncbi:MAG TPA: MarR family transcriptional regulator [Chloroflexia bacterium]|nr:MarR family transcriptional regulator [Chloroflexia bacterium]